MGIKRVLAGFGVDAVVFGASLVDIVSCEPPGVDAGCVGELVAIVCPFGERAPGGSADGSSARVSFRPLSEWGSVRDQASFRLPLVRERCWTDVLPTDSTGLVGGSSQARWSWHRSAPS